MSWDGIYTLYYLYLFIIFFRNRLVCFYLIAEKSKAKQLQKSGGSNSIQINNGRENKPCSLG